MPSLTFWVGYGVLSVLTVIAAATGRNVFLLAVANAVLAVLWWAGDATGYETLGKDYVMVLFWGVLMLPIAVIASAISTGVGRIIFSRRVLHGQQERLGAHPVGRDLSVKSAQHTSLQRQGLIGVGVAFLLGFGQIILGLKGQHSTVYMYADLFVGSSAFGFGSMQYARSKGRSGGWAVMAVLWALGGPLRLLAFVLFLVLVGMTSQSASAKARS